MLGSKNDFFYQDEKTLKSKRRDVKTLLKIKGFNPKLIELVLCAYDYFSKNPHLFDGETIVKDLDDLPNLSIAGLVHDFEYVVYKVWKNPVKKIKADWEYAQLHEQLGKGYFIPYLRAICLIIITPLYYLIKPFN